MYDRRALNISPSLVAMTGGFGRGMKSIGDSLVSLGDDKIKKAKADALKKEQLAKETALRSATNAKNRALNPGAVKAMAKSYNIDVNGPLFPKGAPTQLNKDLGMVDLGTAKAVKPDYGRYKKTGDGVVDVTKGKLIYKDVKTPKVVKPIFKDIPVGHTNYIHRWANGRWVNTGKKSAYQQQTQSKKPDKTMRQLVPVSQLDTKAFRYFQNNRKFIKDKKGNTVVRQSDYNSYKNDMGSYRGK